MIISQLSLKNNSVWNKSPWQGLKKLVSAEGTCQNHYWNYYMIKSHFTVFLTNTCFSLIFFFFYCLYVFLWYHSLLDSQAYFGAVTSASPIILKWNSDNSGYFSLIPLLSLLKKFFLHQKNIFSKNISLKRVLYLIGKKLKLYYLRQIIALYLLNSQQVVDCGGVVPPQRSWNPHIMSILSFQSWYILIKNGCWCFAWSHNLHIFYEIHSQLSLS